MNKGAVVKAVLVLAAFVFLATSAYAEITNTSGLYFRLRQETWDNMFDMNKSDASPSTPNPYARQDENYWRLKSSVWDKVDFDKQYGLFVKITNEARYFNTSNTPAQLGLVADELLFDNLYLYAKKPGGLPVDLTIGRQDLLGVFGEMFLIGDGTPLDGSRTFYFNAARALVTLNDKFNVDLVYLYTQEEDGFLLASNYRKGELPAGFESRQLNSYDEQGIVAYGRGKITDKVTVEPYYMWKEEETPNSSTAAARPALRLNTYGVRAVVGFGEGWKARAEYALQSGEYNDANSTKREGSGGYAYIGRTYDNVSMKPGWDLGYITMSGDDQATTNKNEGWDPLWSRYPQISELYSLTLLTETGIPAYWTNINIYRALVKMAPTEETRLELSYNYLQADKTFSSGGAFGPIFTGTSKERGQLVTAKVSRKFSPILDGYVLVEQFLPGNFYSSNNQFDAQFVRWELQWKI